MTTHENGPFKNLKTSTILFVVAASKLNRCNISIIESPSNGTIRTNNNRITIISSMIMALNLLLKKPESLIPYIVFDATIMEDIPLLAIKYPTPNVIKNAGVIVDEVSIGDIISLKLLPNVFVINVSTKLLDNFKYEQAYPIKVIVGIIERNKKNAICPGRTSIS
jgi:hypothetical protein